METINARTTPLCRRTALFLGLALLVSITTSFTIASATIIYPTNNGFEQPDLGSGLDAFMYNPVAPGWTFTNSSGIAANGSGFNVMAATNGNNDNGATSTSGQAAFLQGGGGTLGPGDVWFSQTLTLTAGTYHIDFSIEGRSPLDGGPGGPTGVDVFLNGVQQGSTLFPTNLTSFNDVSVNLGNLTGGSYTIAFAGHNPGDPGEDLTTFVDNVRFVSGVPDSGSTVVFLMASVMILALFQRAFSAAS